MHLRFVFIAITCLTFLKPEVVCARQQDSGDGKFQCSFFLEIMDAVLANHIDPPAKQQMLLAGVRALYPSHESIPAGLSRQVSSLASNDDFANFLEERRKELVATENETAQARKFIDGMLSAVPGQAILLAGKETKVRDQLEANRYVGIGIALTQKADGSSLIGKSMYGGSGYKAGVRTGDIILEIDGSSTQDKPLSKVVEELRGEEGTEVTLLLQQPNEKPRSLTVTRRVTFIPTIEGVRESAPGKWEYTLDSNPDVAILKFLQIGPSTAHELKKIEAELRSQNIRAVVLDLRDAGGTLHDLVTLADQLLDSGVMGHLQNAEGKFVHAMQPGCLWNKMPLAVIVNSTTGAGPTYLAAALQDARRAIVVGNAPEGNLYAQSRIALSDGSNLQLATGVLCRNTLTYSKADQPISLESTSDANVNRLNFLRPDITLLPQPVDDWLKRAVESLKKSYNK